MRHSALNIIYENPMPHLRAVNSCFPWVCRRKDGALLASHQMGQAFESVDGTTHLSISKDGGLTWSAPWRAFDKAGEDPVMTDCGKACALPDGRIAMLGYQYFRYDHDLPLGNAQTGGLLEDQIYIAYSEDGGRTFGERTPIACAWGNHAEASAPLYILPDGSWATPITGFPDWEGNMTSPRCGRLLRSGDCGKTWSDSAVCMRFPGDQVCCFEQRMCILEDGTLLVIAWNENAVTGERMNNHYTISRGNGWHFSAPMDTGIRAQASSVLAIGGNRILSLHAVRRDTAEPGIYACMADLSGGEWKTERFERIWSPALPISRAKGMAEIFAYLKFGQPGACLLDENTALVFFWKCEEGVYKTCCMTLDIDR